MLRGLVAVLALGLCAPLWAQSAEQLASPAALQSGAVTVWVVTPGNDAERARARFIESQKRAAKYARPPGYAESTAGSFGKPSSETGQTAGSYGQTAGSFGTNASNAGTNAGNYGKSTTDPSISVPASQTAGDYGQTAGSFGQASSTYGQRLSGESLGPDPAAARARAGVEIHNLRREALAAAITANLRALAAPESIHVLSVANEELRDRLLAAEGTDKYPDVLLTMKPHPLGEDSAMEVTMLGWPGAFDGGDTAPATGQGQQPLPEWNFMWPTILVKAPHPARARAFVVWAREVTNCEACSSAHNPALDVPGQMAQDAVASVLSGSGAGGPVDRDAAHFDGALAQRLALLGDVGDGLGGLHLRTDVDRQRSFVTDKLAIVQVRTIASGDHAFGVLHSVVVLRKNDEDRWKVLQVSANEGWTRRTGDLKEWSNAKPRPKEQPCSSCATPATATEDETATPAGVRLASPPDGDNRSPVPTLWWDNLGGAAIQVVEWQWQAPPNGQWTDPRIVLVPDRESHLQTQVPASFARAAGAYRWRVWSIARGGAMKLSEWRSFTVVR